MRFSRDRKLKSSHQGCVDTARFSSSKKVSQQTERCAEMLEMRYLLSAYTLNNLVTFGTSTGAFPAGGLVLSGSTLYGTTSGYGPDNGGDVFSIPTTGGTPTILASFDSATGTSPVGSLLLSGSTLYGVTSAGGPNGAQGTVYSLPITGGTPTVLASFSSQPSGGLVLSGSTLYGTASGGADSYGQVFAVPVTGGSDSEIASFNGTDGAYPNGGLIVSGSTLYGTTAQGGGQGSYGTVFSVPITGGTPSVLASFDGTTASNPQAGLILSGSTLYGTTEGGGSNLESYGTVFSLPITGGTPTILTSLLSSNDGTPNAGTNPGAALFLSGNTLFGTATAGGSTGDVNGAGTVFSVPVTGGSATAIASFSGSNGGDPVAGLVADAAGNLYGTTMGGLSQNYGYGTLFQLTLGDTNQLAITTQPTSTLTGNAISPAVQVSIELAGGSVSSSDDSVITLSVASGPAGSAAPTGTTTVTASNGVANFSNFILSTPGDYTLVATGESLTSPASALFTVTAPGGASTATELQFASQPGSATVSATITPAVTVDVGDSNGNIVTGDSSSVTLSIASGTTGAVLGGTLTEQAVDGVATFSNLSLNAAGTYTLTATDGALAAAGSSAFVISSATASQLVFGVQPSNAEPGAVIAPAVIVDVDNSSGQFVGTDASAVTIAIASGPAGATLGGTLTELAVNGVATFSDLSLGVVGTYTLTATDGALAAVDSSAFTIAVITPVSPLVPTMGKVVLSTTAVAGSPVTAKVPVVVANLGALLKGNVTVNIFANLGTTLDGNQVFITSLTRKNVVLRTGRTTSFGFNIRTLPVTLPAGTYHLLAEVVDGSGAINVAATTQTVQVAAPFVDLTDTVSNLSQVPIKPGSTAAAAVTVTNLGNVSAIGRVAIDQALTADGTTLVLPEVFSESIRLLPGTHRTYLFNDRIPVGFTPGTFSWVSTVDPADTFNESTAINNTAVSPTQLTILDPFPNILGIYTGTWIVKRGPVGKGDAYTQTGSFLTESNTTGSWTSEATDLLNGAVADAFTSAGTISTTGVFVDAAGFTGRLLRGVIRGSFRFVSGAFAGDSGTFSWTLVI